MKPVGAGVIELPWQWSVTAEVYAAVRMGEAARPHASAAVHTHLSSHTPRMSRTDRTQGLKVPDGLAVIVRAGGEEADPRRWGWFVYDDGDYRTLDAGELGARITFTAADVDYAEIPAVEGA